MQRVHGRGSASGGCNLSVQGGCHGHLAQVQGEFEVTVNQRFGFGSGSIGGGWTHHEDGWVVEGHLDGHFLHGDQQLASTKQRRIGGEEHRIELAPRQGVHGFFHGGDASLLRFCQTLVVCMGSGAIDGIGRQQSW